MRREFMSVLLGASILAPVHVDAQRVRPRGGNRDAVRVERTQARTQRPGQPAPFRASGRIARPVRSPAVRSWRTADRVVYSSRGRFHGRARSAAFRGRFGARGFRANHVWIRADFGQLRIFAPRQSRFHVLYASDLRYVLGHRTMAMVRRVGRRSGLRGVMRGHWVHDAGVGTVLVVSIGHVDVVEFIDFNRDGFIDDVFVISGGRGVPVAARW